ncbi:putative late blight resistance protein homolog R1A-4 [Nicotiana tomentosiformis]|uniref:putative late blight resistance protein homolog R1A-4 n=1 Tax=Nicotiana tomentosiformis TaxID=4098 RepID=UPI00388C6D27
MINLKHVDISEGEVHFNGVGAEKEDVFELEKLESFSKVVLVNEDDISEMCNRAPNLVQLELMTLEHWGSLFSSLMCLIYLETLAIYHRSEFPMSGISMIFPQSLKELTLSCCGFLWDEISRIGALPNLEVLNLLSAFIGRKWTVGVGGFLNLRFLKIEHNSIKHWNMSVDSFPCLEQLVLRWCGKLEEIPSSFGSMPSLQRIEARSCCPSARKSAVKIRNMQRDDMKNSDFKVIIYLN